jgi:hypothetical protein
MGNRKVSRLCSELSCSLGKLTRNIAPIVNKFVDLTFQKAPTNVRVESRLHRS